MVMSQSYVDAEAGDHAARHRATPVEEQPAPAGTRWSISHSVFPAAGPDIRLALRDRSTATLSRRVAALATDLVAILIGAWVVSRVAELFGVTLPFWAPVLLLAVLDDVVGLGWLDGSIGQRLVGIRVRQADGHSLLTVDNVARLLAAHAVLAASLGLLLIAEFWLAVSAGQRRLVHDEWSGTRVVRRHT